MADALSIRLGRKVSERRMRPLIDVVPLIALKHSARFNDRTKQLAIEEFVSEPRIEALGEPVLPRRARFDEEGADGGFF